MTRTRKLILTVEIIDGYTSVSTINTATSTKVSLAMHYRLGSKWTITASDNHGTSSMVEQSVLEGQHRKQMTMDT